MALADLFHWFCGWSLSLSSTAGSPWTPAPKLEAGYREKRARKKTRMRILSSGDRKEGTGKDRALLFGMASLRGLGVGGLCLETLRLRGGREGRLFGGRALL